MWTMFTESQLGMLNYEKAPYSMLLYSCGKVDIILNLNYDRYLLKGLPHLLSRK